MKLKDYIDQGYTVLTFGRLSQKIKEKYPNALTHDQDFIGSDKLLIDDAVKGTLAFKEIIDGASDISFRKFTREFCGDFPTEKPKPSKSRIRKAQSLTLEGKQLDLIADVIFELIDVFSKNFETKDDACHQEKLRSAIVGSKRIIFYFWSYDEDVREIERTITDVYDVKIVE